MNKIFLNQVGVFSDSAKRAVLNYEADKFYVFTTDGKEVYSGTVSHFGKDEISGEDTFVADFSDFDKEGSYFVKAGDVESCRFEIGNNAYEKLMKDLCKCFYYLRCGTGLDEKYAGVYAHKPCHTSLATVYGEETDKVDVTGGWHDAGDFGRYSTAGAVAVAHLLYGVKFFPELAKVSFDIPKDGNLPAFLAEVKVELDFLMKMQRENGGVWHKVTTYSHAPFIMPEDDLSELFLFPVSSLATADIAAVCALASSVYKEYDEEYAGKLMNAAKKAYAWLDENPQPVLFRNAPGSNTGEYGEWEDISNRFWAAASMYEVTGEKNYYSDACFQKDKLVLFAKEAPAKLKLDAEKIFTMFGWADVAGLGALSFFIKNEENELTTFLKKCFANEADRLVEVSAKNGFGLCMESSDFIWGSNMELGKYLMVLTIADRFADRKEYRKAIDDGIGYLLGCNSMDTSYVTGNGEKAFKNPHLRPTAVDGIEEPWPGLVSGGPNKGLQDQRAQEVDKNSAPMKCYLDHIDCYSLNEITIYWNSPFVFVLAGLMF